ncbi:MAG: glycosyltransferase family 25 protein [Pseudomonadota bacterium]
MKTEPLATYVINLARAPERMKKSEAMLESLGLGFTRIEANDGSSIPSNVRVNSAPYAGRDLLSGELGCFLSHRAAAEAFLASEAQLGLVLEDDAADTDQTRAVLSALEDARARFTIWDVMNLGKSASRWRTPVRQASYDGPGQLCHAHYFPVTTTALLWSRGGARGFLMMSQEIRLPVDVQLQDWVRKTDRGLAFEAAVFEPRGESSLIHQKAGKTTRSSSARTSQYRMLRLKRQLGTHLSAARHRWLRSKTQ